MPAMIRRCRMFRPYGHVRVPFKHFVFIMQLLIIPQEPKLHNIFEEAHYSE